jgi:hypothetical protein
MNHSSNQDFNKNTPAAGPALNDIAGTVPYAVSFKSLVIKAFRN